MGYKTDEAYKPKNHWRRWAWNQIKSRLKVPTREALVLYLPGDKDADREVALSKGFAPHNLIAVDTDPANIARVRAAGGIGICERLQEVLLHWPGNWPIHGVVADLQRGLHRDTHEVLEGLLESWGVRRTAVVVNLLRGRDPLGVDFVRRFGVSGASKNRALWAEAYIKALLAGRVIPKMPGEIEVKVGKHLTLRWLEDLPPQAVEGARRCCDLFSLTARPKFYSYPSDKGHQKMDSVALTWTAPWIDGMIRAGIYDESIYEGMPLRGVGWWIDEVYRKIVALRAVRTRRMAA